MWSDLVESRLTPRWLHAWSVLTVCVTVALLALGAVVTTFQVGMADPVWPTYPWHLALIDWHEPNPGYVIEHTHRLFGYIVGCCTIVLTVGMLLSARRTWLKWLGAAALAGVIVQGLFGGYRVVLHAWLGAKLAIIHGCFAQVVFSLFVALAVLSAARGSAAALSEDESRRLQLWSLILTALVFLQLVWGALVRHTNGALAQRMHFFTAFAIVAAAVWLGRAVHASPTARRVLGRTMIILAGLLALQIFLGIESWLGKYFGILLPEAQKLTVGQAATRVAHVLVGSFVLATSVSLTVLAHGPHPEFASPANSLGDSEKIGRVRVPDQPNSTTIVPHLEGSA